ncbi:ABC transporter permease [Acrocarpospora catenulata]|uniref:ABC transporter permease n=1 Tax=Acrocarpospora catenulata TaxID=2836182 RepID=UPI001BDA3E82|nr:ABC transporter permease [Acrocarpospora catenulata]
MPPMARYILRRLGHAVLVVFGVSIIVFLVMHLAGGSPLSVLLPPEASEAERRQYEALLGLDQPLYVQYWDFASQAVRGDFGQSIWYGRPAAGLVLERLQATAELAVSGLGLAVLVALPLGVLAAVYRNRTVDHAIGIFVVLGQSVPIFWLGMLLVLQFSVNWPLFPTSGRDSALSFVLPALTLAVYSMARLTRLTRAGMLEVLNQDHLRTARAKGMPERVVIFRHGVRNALIPFVTYLGLEFGGLLGGAVVVETVFSWPGVGRLATEAIFNRDYPLVQAVVFIVALVFVAVNLLVDLLYPALDPRIRLASAS